MYIDTVIYSLLVILIHNNLIINNLIVTEKQYLTIFQQNTPFHYDMKSSSHTFTF